MRRELKIEPNKIYSEDRELRVRKYLNMIAKEDTYNDFKNKVYSTIVAYKDECITKESGIYRGVKYKEFLPEEYWNKELPEMLYCGIRTTVAEMQKSPYKYKPHLFAFKHVASSQTACVNLFVPILESSYVNDILKALDVCPTDFKCIAKDVLFHGYRFEFWDSIDESAKGLLGDHTKQAGTDSDIAIAYYNTNDELCLWLIEHKLTEREFTECGAYKSKGNTLEGKANCKKCSMADIIANPDLCYYHRVSKYNYWNIMIDGAANFFNGKYEEVGCPFRGGLNQLWRNQLLAVALENEGTYKKVSFSVVHHPENHFLDGSMQKYSKLVNNSPMFNSFASDAIISVASLDPNLNDWIDWYKKVYYGV